MIKLRTHILFLCDKCGRMKIVPRSDTDLKDAVFVEVCCDRCSNSGDKGETLMYYDQKGYMNEREGIFD
jgi:hypothetical protein